MTLLYRDWSGDSLTANGHLRRHRHVEPATVPVSRETARADGRLMMIGQTAVIHEVVVAVLNTHTQLPEQEDRSDAPGVIRAARVLAQLLQKLCCPCLPSTKVVGSQRQNVPTSHTAEVVEFHAVAPGHSVLGDG